MKKIILLFSAGLGDDEPIVEKTDTTIKKETTLEEDEIVHISKKQLDEIQEFIKKSTEPKSEGLTKADLLAMGAEIAKGIAKGTSASSQQVLQNRVFGFNPINFDDIDPSDYLETPAVFFCYKTKTKIYDDYVRGQVIQCPIQAISFTTVLRTVKNEGRKLVYNTMSSAVVMSKKQAEFLRNHSEFGITFFESIADASKSVSQAEAQSLSEASTALAQKNDFEIHKMALGYGLNLDTMDTKEIRMRVVKRHAQTILENKTKLMKNIQEREVELQSVMRQEKTSTVIPTKELV